jgi:hypothetical protein
VSVTCKFGRRDVMRGAHPGPDHGSERRIDRRIQLAGHVAAGESDGIRLTPIAVELEDIQDGPGHADARTTRRYDHGGIRLDRSPAYTLAGYLTA